MAREPVWSRPAWEGWQRAASERITAALPTLDAALAAAQPRGSSWLEGPRAKRDKAEFVAALVSGDARRAAAASARLAGLGEGLTPAADDFLVGALYALRALRPAQQVAGLAAAVTTAAAPRTTTPSAVWLRRAGAGEVTPAWDGFLRALLVSGDGEEAIRGVLAIGHTSGPASLEGFAAAARALLAGEEGRSA